MHNQLSPPHPPGPWNQIRGDSHNALGTSRVRGEEGSSGRKGGGSPFSEFSPARFAFLGGHANVYILLNNCQKFDGLCNSPSVISVQAGKC